MLSYTSNIALASWVIRPEPSGQVPTEVPPRGDYRQRTYLRVGFLRGVTSLLCGRTPPGDSQ